MAAPLTLAWPSFPGASPWWSPSIAKPQAQRRRETVRWRRPMKRATPSRRAVDGKQDVNAYIAAAPEESRPLLRKLRQLVPATVPEAEERLSYRLPYYRHHGPLIYFAAFAQHVGVYIMGRSKERFAKELEAYRKTPATLRFEFGARLPMALLRRVLKARAVENEAGKVAGRVGSGRAGRVVVSRPRKTARRSRA